MGRSKGYELLRALALREIVAVIRKRGTASAAEIMSDTGRSRGNVDGYLRELEDGRHVVRGLPPIPKRKGATFVYTAIEGEVVELPAMREPTGAEHDEIVNATVAGGDVPPSLDLTATEQRAAAHAVPLNPEDLSDDELLARIRRGELTVTGRFPGRTFASVAEHASALQESPAFERMQPSSVLTVVPESRGKPIPASVQVQIGSADAGLIECGPCSEAGGADRGVYHEPPECSTTVKAPALGLKARQSGRQGWKGGFMHLTKGGEFELCDLGGGKTSIRRVLGPGSYSSPVTLATSEALAMFVQKPAQAPKAARVDTGEVWVTPKPPDAQPPITSRTIKNGADDLGHFGQGSRASDAGEGGETFEHDDEGAE